MADLSASPPSRWHHALASPFLLLLLTSCLLKTAGSSSTCSNGQSGPDPTCDIPVWGTCSATVIGNALAPGVNGLAVDSTNNIVYAISPNRTKIIRLVDPIPSRPPLVTPHMGGGLHSLRSRSPCGLGSIGALTLIPERYDRGALTLPPDCFSFS